MSVEILSVSLSDESVERLAQRVAQLVGGQPATHSNPPSSQNPQDAAGPASGGNDDPWQNQPPAQNQQQGQYMGQQGQWQQQPVQQQSPPPQQQTQQYNVQGPTCAHGAMRYVPSGVIKSGPRQGQTFPAFYGCPLPKGAQGKCSSVQA